jgi:hypothetical protein
MRPGRRPAHDAAVTAPAGPVVYQPLRVARRVLPAVLVVFVVLAVVFLTQAARHSGPPWWFLVLWLAAFGWNAYWWTFRICTEVRVDGGRLAWRTPLRRDEVALSDVTRVRPSRWGRGRWPSWSSATAARCSCPCATASTGSSTRCAPAHRACRSTPESPGRVMMDRP